MRRFIRRCGSILTASWLVMMVCVMPAAASTTTGALYSGDIVVKNTSFASAYNTVPITLSTQTLIDGNYIESDCLNTAITDGSGADVPYMPATGSSSTTWMVFVDNIEQNASNLYKLYTGGSDMNGEICYFPDTAGMTVNDSASLEPGNDFTTEITGFFDTSSGASKYPVGKTGAEEIYNSNTSELTVKLYPASGYSGYSSSSDGYVYNAAAPYSTAQSAATGTVSAGATTAIIGQNAVSASQTQTTGGNIFTMYNGSNVRVAEKSASSFTGTIYSVVYMISRSGSPTGTISLNIRNASTDAVIGTLGTMSAASLTTNQTAYTFNTAPVTVSSTAIRVSIEFSGGDASNYIHVGYYASGGSSWGIMSSYTSSWNDSTYGSADLVFNPIAYYTTLPTINRSFFYFDTSSIPAAAVITSASLGLYGQGDSSTTDFNLTVINGQATYPHDPLAAGDFAISNYNTTSGGSLTTSGFSVAGYNTINLNSTGYGFITKGGTTKLAVVSDRDIAATAPTGAEYVTVYTQEQGTTYRPVLTISYYVALVATGVTSAEHTVKVDTVGGNFVLYIDGVSKASTPAFSIINNANNWVFFQNGAMPYVVSAKLSVGGVLKGSWAWQNALTFTDLSGNGNTATPTFRTTTTDADVTATLNSLSPNTLSELTGYQPTGAPTGLLTTVPAEPVVTVNQDTAWAKVPGGEVVLSILDVSDIPPALFFMPVMLLIVGIAILVTYHFTRDMFFTGIAGNAVIGAFISISALYVIVLIVGIIAMVVVLTKRKTVSL